MEPDKDLKSTFNPTFPTTIPSETIKKLIELLRKYPWLVNYKTEVQLLVKKGWGFSKIISYLKKKHNIK